MIKHTHQALYNGGKLMRDCSLCGEDLTAEVHLRVGERAVPPEEQVEALEAQIATLESALTRERGALEQALGKLGDAEEKLATRDRELAEARESADAQRQSLVNELRVVLESRGLWAPRDGAARFTAFTKALAELEADSPGVSEGRFQSVERQLSNIEHRLAMLEFT